MKIYHLDSHNLPLKWKDPLISIVHELTILCSSLNIIGAAVCSFGTCFRSRASNFLATMGGKTFLGS